MSTKTFSFLLLAALAAAAEVPSPIPAAPLIKTKKIQVGLPKEIAVSQPAAVAIPLTLVAGDYNGPYDPRDPDGVIAATRRRRVLAGEATLQEIRSYIPPGAIEALKKDLVKVVMNEVSRFAFAHPKEAAELVSIFNKATAIYTNTAHKLKALEKKQASAANQKLKEIEKKQASAKKI